MENRIAYNNISNYMSTGTLISTIRIGKSVKNTEEVTEE